MMLVILQVPPAAGVDATAKILLPQITSVTGSKRTGFCMNNHGILHISDKQILADVTPKEIYLLPWTNAINLKKSKGEILLYSPSNLCENDIQTIQAFLEEIFSNSQKYDALIQKAATDELTHLPNKTNFIEKLEKEIFKCSRNHSSFSLIFLDVDNFKQINDREGHLVGDKVLCKIANKLQKCMRKDDVVARFGGDEFVMVLTNMEPGEEKKILSRLVKNINGINTYSTSVSFGVAYYPRDGTTPKELIEIADKRMYQKKSF